MVKNNLINRQLFYDHFADEFDERMNKYDVNRRLDIVFNEFLHKVGLKNKKLLDAGCGTGLFAKEACLRGARVTALDIGANLLKKVQEKCNAKIVHGDLLKLPFPDNSFDIVIAIESIEHTKNPRKAISEVIRVTKKNGYFIITTPNLLWHFAVDIAEKLNLRPYRGLENWIGHSELKNYIEVKSSQIIEYKGFHLAPLFPIVFSHPFLRFFDHAGNLIGRYMFNIAAFCQKK